MKKTTQIADDIARSPWVVIFGIVSSLGGLGMYVYDKVQLNQLTTSLIVFVVSLIILSFGIVYSFRVRSENLILKHISSNFNRINSIYRDSLSNTFEGDIPIDNTEDLLNEEEKVLRSVCQRIENIYSQLIARECTVTLKLKIEADGKDFVRTYTRSVEQSIRDQPERKKYEIGTGENTAFDKAMQQTLDKVSYFHSPDTTQEKKYRNQRTNYYEYYRSVIVVPIWSPNNTKEKFIGFLCIDTKSINRLKDGYQIQIASSLASQMYNYISLMRGEYTFL
jgi:hypothetical protein